VRVDSSPSASPLTYFSSIISSSNVFSRRHPDQHNDVWEVSVWDPKPFNLELFALFSPGHVLVYWLFLPTSAADPRPSVTFVTTILLAVLLSVQLLFFKRFFVQQAKDSTLIHKEVMNEYDTKFVHPNMNRPVRDVGTQTRDTATSPGGARIRTREVDVYTPHTVINKGFKVNPNPAYASHLTDDPEPCTPLRRLRICREALQLRHSSPHLEVTVQLRRSIHKCHHLERPTNRQISSILQVNQDRCRASQQRGQRYASEQQVQ